MNFLISQNTLTDLKGEKENIICTIDTIVRGDFLGPPHGTSPATGIANKNETEILQEK